MERNFAEELRNPKKYIENFLCISNKKKQIVHLKLKPAQLRFYEAVKREHEAGRPPRFLILKARQEGFSTLVEALMFQDTATRPLVRTMIAAHREDSTANLFKMHKLFFDRLPMAIKPMRKSSNAQEIVFENPTRREEEKLQNPGLMSSIRCVTAGGDGIGRSDTLTNFHGSEVAFWRGDVEETLNGIMQAVPNDPGTLVVLESTANGYNFFKKLWDGAEKGENGFVPFFSSWHEEPEYRMQMQPDTEWTEEEKALQSAYGLDEEQLTWRRWCIKNNCAGNVDKFRQEYPSCPEEAFLFSGTPFFDNDKIVVLLAKVKPAAMVGAFAYPEPESEGGKPEEWTWREDAKTGFVKIFAKPVQGRPYTIGADPAGEGSDRYIAFVIDNITGEQVAELAFTTGDILFSRQLWCLGHWYNNALLGVEVNYNTYCSRKLEEWGYEKLYVREEAPDTYTHRTVKKYGFRTDRMTRPVILSALQTMMQEQGELIRSADTLREMLHFVYNADRRPEAEEGEHDDRVMAAAICYYIRPQQRMTEEKTQKAAVWRDDQYEDYRNADPAGKKYLLKKWGNPWK